MYSHNYKPGYIILFIQCNTIYQGYISHKEVSDMLCITSYCALEQEQQTCFPTCRLSAAEHSKTTFTSQQ